MDIALAIEKILYGAEYFGAVYEQTEKCYNELDWRDERIPKPSWVDIEQAWNEIKDIEAEKTETEVLQEKIQELEARLSELEKKEVIK